MSGRRPERPEYLLALLTTVLWAACAFAATGVLSLVLDREPVARPVGPAFAFLALGAAALPVWLGAALTPRAARPWTGMVGAASAAYLAIVASAFLVDLGLLVEQAASPFVIVAAALAAPAVGLAWLLATRPAPRTRD